MEVVSKKSSKLVKFKSLFKPNVTPPPSLFLLEAVSKKVQIKKARAAVQMHECSGLVKLKNPCGNFSDTSNFFSMEVVSKIFSTQMSKISGFDTLT